MAGINGKVVLVTGASSGIGEATARYLAEQGAKVVVGARRTDRLETLVNEIREKGGVAEYQALDVTQPEDFESFVAFAEGKFGAVDVLVNNAGLMPLSALEALKMDEWNRMIDVNIRGVLHGIAAVLPRMRKRAKEEGRVGGQIINVSSIAGHQTFPTAAVYCATKYAVVAISEGLRQEVDDVRVTTISPGVTESELAETITDPTSQEYMKEFRKTAIPAMAIAEAIGFAISQPDSVDVSEIIARPTAGYA